MCLYALQSSARTHSLYNGTFFFVFVLSSHISKQSQINEKFFQISCIFTLFAVAIYVIMSLRDDAENVRTTPQITCNFHDDDIVVESFFSIFCFSFSLWFSEMINFCLFLINWKPSIRYFIKWQRQNKETERTSRRMIRLSHLLIVYCFWQIKSTFSIESISKPQHTQNLDHLIVCRLTEKSEIDWTIQSDNFT